MLGVVQESVRPLWANTKSHLGYSCPGCWWTLFGGLHTLFSVKNKGFHSLWCWNKQVPLVFGRCQMIGKDLEQVWITVERSPPPTGFKERGDSLKWFGESRTQDSEQIQRSQWLDTRNQKSSVLYFTPSLFHSLFFDGLILTTFFLKASTPSEGVQATCPRVLYPEGISNKERKYWRHQSSRVFSEWPTSYHVYSPR